MTCTKCEKLEYAPLPPLGTPEPLCPDHWFDWFYAGAIEQGLISKEELEEQRKEFLEFGS